MIRPQAWVFRPSSERRPRPGHRLFSAIDQRSHIPSRASGGEGKLDHNEFRTDGSDTRPGRRLSALVAEDATKLGFCLRATGIAPGMGEMHLAPGDYRRPTALLDQPDASDCTDCVA